MEVVYFPSCKATVVLPSFAAYALRACNSGRTMAEHASRLSSSGAPLSEIRQILANGPSSLSNF